MFIGHFGVGLAGKRLEPRASLGTWFLSAQFVDLLWPLFVLLGWEHVRIAPGITRVNALDFTDYPYTHSLAAVLVWAVVFALVYYARTRRQHTALLLGAGVLSHWFLDLIVHRPDLPLAPGTDARFGLGLWNSRPGSLIAEIGLYAVGAGLYLASTRVRDGIGRWGAWALLLFLPLVYLADFVGPPPPSVNTVVVTGLAGGLLLWAWAEWGDRHREPAAR
jgi:hypothetical protein